MNDLLNRFVLASGTFRNLPDGSFWKASFRRWVGSYNICLAFLFSAALCILDKCFCSLPINFLAVLTTQASFILFLPLTLPYHVIMLTYRKLPIKPLYTSWRMCWLTWKLFSFLSRKNRFEHSCKHNQYDHIMTSIHQVMHVGSWTSPHLLLLVIYEYWFWWLSSPSPSKH